MKQHEALLLKRLVEQDKRIKVRIMGHGQGFRLQLALHKGTANERTLECGHKQDVEQVTYLWEGL